MTDGYNDETFKSWNIPDSLDLWWTRITSTLWRHNRTGREIDAIHCKYGDDGSEEFINWRTTPVMLYDRNGRTIAECASVYLAFQHCWLENLDGICGEGP